MAAVVGIVSSRGYGIEEQQPNESKLYRFVMFT